MKSRLLTAGILIPLALGSLYLGGAWLLAIVMVAAAITIHEILSMMKLVKQYWFFGLVITQGIILSTNSPVWQKPVMGALIAMGILLMIAEVLAKKLWLPKNDAMTVIRMAVFVGVGYGFYLTTRSMDHGLFRLFFTCILIWTTDTMALFGGKYFGKRLLAPTLSPKKTIEGTVIGFASAIGVGAILAVVGHVAILPCLGRAALIGVVGQFGDLHESLMKRTFGVKDSSKLLPGHGGFYDRQDSTLFVLPTVFYSWIPL